MSTGVDYSAAKLTGTAISRAGHSFTIRYIDEPKRLSTKHTNASEYASLRAAGIAVYFVIERTRDDFLGGLDKGRELATAALAGLKHIGAPSNSIVFVTADRHMTAAEFPVWRSFLFGAGMVIPHSQLGAYGFDEAIETAYRYGLASWYWQCGRVIDTREPGDFVHVYQRNNERTYINGVECDINDQLRPMELDMDKRESVKVMNADGTEYYAAYEDLTRWIAAIWQAVRPGENWQVKDGWLQGAFSNANTRIPVIQEQVDSLNEKVDRILGLLEPK